VLSAFMDFPRIRPLLAFIGCLPVCTRPEHLDLPVSLSPPSPLGEGKEREREREREKSEGCGSGRAMGVLPPEEAVFCSFLFLRLFPAYASHSFFEICRIQKCQTVKLLSPLKESKNVLRSICYWKFRFPKFQIFVFTKLKIQIGLRCR
jgi:hypothetical protein